MTDKISSEDFIKAFGGGVKHNLKRPQGDLISREALKEKLKERYYNDGLNIVTAIELIDNAPTVEAFTKEDMAGAYNEGYACGGRESKRPNEQIAWEQGFEAGLAQAVEITEEQAINKLHETGWLIGHDKEMTDRPKGEWINREAISNTIFPFWERYECNQCHKFNGYSNFCPNCGADMRETVQND